MLTALFSAIYVIYGYASSVTVGMVTHGVDTFFIRSALFVLLTAFTAKFGPSTLMGTIAGILFALVVPAPFPIYLFPSTLMYGLTYDLYMHLIGYSTHVMRAKHVMLASAFSSAIMSLVALSILTWVGFLPVKGLAFIWFFGVSRDVGLGLAGGLLGFKAMKYVSHWKT